MTVETRERIGEPEVRVKTPADILRSAARYIEEFGWHQGDYESGGAVCAMGAIRFVAHGNQWEDNSAALVLAGSLRRTTGRGNIAEWNDTPGRTAAEVTAALRAAADADDYENVR